MLKRHPFHQVDVFTAVPYLGNALAVVHDAATIGEADMASFARWTNLSETTYLLPPTDPGADYRVRIFTPGAELPFAGHPTLGSCAAWLAAGGVPRDAAMIVQECGVGLVRLRRDGARLAFAAPPLRRSGPIEADAVPRIAAALGVPMDAIVAHQWVDNGPGWCALLLNTAEEVLALTPDYAALGDVRVGVAAPQPAGAETDFEVRVFVPSLGINEDPVTGSLNAGLAQWLIGAGLAPPSYIAQQGSRLGRAGKVVVEQVGDDIWIGGEVASCIEGTVQLPVQGS